MKNLYESILDDIETNLKYGDLDKDYNQLKAIKASKFKKTYTMEKYMLKYSDITACELYTYHWSCPSVCYINKLYNDTLNDSIFFVVKLIKSKSTTEWCPNIYIIMANDGWPKKPYTAREVILPAEGTRSKSKSESLKAAIKYITELDNARLREIFNKPNIDPTDIKYPRHINLIEYLV